MSAIPWSLDTTAKRWLAVLAVAVLGSVAVLAHAFYQAMTPAEASPASTQPPTRPATGEVRTKAEPTWDAPKQTAITEPVAERVSPFAARDADKAANEQTVHTQAEYFRKLIAENKVPSGLGNLTKEQVDDMERRGIMVW